MRPLLAILSLLALAQRLPAYVDYTPTLGQVIRESQSIVLVEVDKVNRDARAFICHKIADFRGQTPDSPIKQQLTDGNPPAPPRIFLDWAQPGRKAILFITDDSCLVCIGRHWYQAQPAPDGWWRMSIERPDLPLAYCGSVQRLASAVKEIVAGKRAVISTCAHGADGVGACFDVAFNRTDSPSSRKMQRIWASLAMPTMVCYVSANPQYFVGPGPAGPDEIPSLLKTAQGPDHFEALEAVQDLASLGPVAKHAISPLETLLQQPNIELQTSSASALLRISPNNPAALRILRSDLASTSIPTRKLALDALSHAGPAAAGALDELRACLKDPNPELQSAAIRAIGEVGPSAASAAPDLTSLLDNPALRCDAADALGHLRQSARPVASALASRMSDPDLSFRWALVRALVQIGGPDSKAAVPFLIDQVQHTPRGRDLYNISVYLGLLGPIAKDAIPALEWARLRDRELCAMALWAIEPEKTFPWQWGYTVDREIDRWLFEAYIREMGPERAKPAAQALVKAILSNSAGRIPSWGYQLLLDFPEVAIDPLKKAQDNPSPSVRQSAITALRQMDASQ